MTGKLSQHRGFSLFELLLMMVLGCILITIAVPPVQRVAGAYKLRSSAGTVTAELNAARVLAISRGAQYQIAVDETGLQVLDTVDPENPTRVRKELHDGVRFRSIPQNPIIFYSRGHAQAGSLELANDEGGAFRIDVQASGHIRTTAIE